MPLKTLQFLMSPFRGLRVHPGVWNDTAPSAHKSLRLARRILVALNFYDL